MTYSNVLVTGRCYRYFLPHSSSFFEHDECDIVHGKFICHLKIVNYLQMCPEFKTFLLPWDFVTVVAHLVQWNTTEHCILITHQYICKCVLRSASASWVHQVCLG